MKNYYLLVPILNGEKFIQPFIENVPLDLRSHLIFIDDGSTDGTANILTNSPFTVLKHPKNLGKGKSIRTGMEWIQSNGGGIIVMIDIDLQHPPQLIPEFLQVKYNEICLGYRSSRLFMPVLRQISNFMTSLLISIRSGVIIKDSQCGFRSFHSSLFDRLECMESGFQFESEMLIKATQSGLKIKHIKIPTLYNSQDSHMHYFFDSMKFIRLWIKSYFWV